MDALVLGLVVRCGGVGDGEDERSGAVLLEGVCVGPDLVGGVEALAVVVAIGVVGVKGASGIDKAGGIIIRVVAVVGGSVGIKGVGEADDAGVVVEIAVAVGDGAIGIVAAAAAAAAAAGVVEGVGAFAGDGVRTDVGMASGADTGGDGDGGVAEVEGMRQMLREKSMLHRVSTFRVRVSRKDGRKVVSA